MARRRNLLKLNAPKEGIWIAATILGGLGILGYFLAIPFISANAFFFVAVGFLILALATVLKGV